MSAERVRALPDYVPQMVRCHTAVARIGHRLRSLRRDDACTTEGSGTGVLRRGPDGLVARLACDGYRSEGACVRSLWVLVTTRNRV